MFRPQAFVLHHHRGCGSDGPQSALFHFEIDDKSNDNNNGNNNDKNDHNNGHNSNNNHKNNITITMIMIMTVIIIAIVILNNVINKRYVTPNQRSICGAPVIRGDDWHANRVEAPFESHFPTSASPRGVDEKGLPFEEQKGEIPGIYFVYIFCVIFLVKNFVVVKLCLLVVINRYLALVLSTRVFITTGY